MGTWRDLAEQRSDLATAGRDLLYQFGVGLAFLATVRADGGPRLNPMCPLLADDRVFAFIVPGPKCRDLDRDGRYAMHSFPCPTNEDAFMLTGTATRVADPELRRRLVAQFLGERSDLSIGEADMAEQALFEFGVDRVLLTRTTGHGDAAPCHTVWAAPA
ncbi:MAG: pyridoxamine 5'-phosphate oxidase family protein [Acidimicrobiia bacterium]